MPADEEGTDAGLDRLHPYQRLGARELRHHDVEDHEIDRLGIAREKFDGVGTVFREQDLVAEIREAVAEELPYQQLVLGDQDRLAPVDLARSRGLGPKLRAVAVERKVDVKRAAVADPALGADLAPVLPDDPVDHR